MRIVVTDLTRIQQGFMCVAGIDPDSGAHIRPVVPDSRLPTELLAAHGGPFDIGAIVDIGEPSRAPVKPQVEDWAFDPGHCQRLGTTTPADLWELLSARARDSFADIFGSDLFVQPGQAAAVAPGRGQASLGVFRPPAAPRLYVQSRPEGRSQVRMSLSDPNVELDLSVTDIRLFGPDHVTLNEAVVHATQRRLDHGEPFLLSVGLTRPFAPSPEREPRHWLQVNNIHFQADAARPLGGGSWLTAAVRWVRWLLDVR